LQFSLLKILNDLSVDTPEVIRLRSLSLEDFLVQCKDSDFVSLLLNQEKQIDSTEFKALIVEIVGPGSGTSEINLLLDYVRTNGPLSVLACQRLPIIFPTSSEKTQLQIARLLVNQIEGGTPVSSRYISVLIFNRHCRKWHHLRWTLSI
jgi:hypothetical protein